MAAWCGTRGFPFMPAYQLTEGADSWDGTHYGLSINMAYAQVLLNALGAWRPERQARVVL
jgi:hypothetical protein